MNCAGGLVPAALPAAVPEDEDNDSGVIERIVRAERIGGGWRLYVKWEGHAQITAHYAQRAESTSPRTSRKGPWAPNLCMDSLH